MAGSHRIDRQGKIRRHDCRIRRSIGRHYRTSTSQICDEGRKGRQKRSCNGREGILLTEIVTIRTYSILAALHRKSSMTTVPAVYEGVNQLANWIENPRSGSLLERREYF